MNEELVKPDGHGRRFTIADHVANLLTVLSTNIGWYLDNRVNLVEVTTNGDISPINDYSRRDVGYRVQVESQMDHFPTELNFMAQMYLISNDQYAGCMRQFYYLRDVYRMVVDISTLRNVRRLRAKLGVVRDEKGSRCYIFEERVYKIFLTDGDRTYIEQVRVAKRQSAYERNERRTELVGMKSRKELLTIVRENDYPIGSDLAFHELVKEIVSYEYPPIK